jgi:hypothetical protein
MSIDIIEVPTGKEPFQIEIESGRSIIFLGANGSGKTRLGVYIEKKLSSHKVRRIPAHKSLLMRDSVSGISYEDAYNLLQYGKTKIGNQGETLYSRWGDEPATKLLSDFDQLLQALFAQQHHAAVTHLANHRIDPAATPPVTSLQKLELVWDRILPHRKLHVLDYRIHVNPPEGQGLPYGGSNMSDGERVIFYLLGHCLLAPKDAVIIIDEPELHVHKAIIYKLWDIIEAERPDCGFVYITHDLDFLTSRPAASKYVVKSYTSSPAWSLEALPEGTGLPERLISELAGNRQPVMFVEGTPSGLDTIVYRSLFSDYLLKPIGSCSAVIHAVTTFRDHESLHHIGKVCGFIDADSRSQLEIEQLAKRHVFVLPVAEVENLLLLPTVFHHIARAMNFQDTEIKDLEAQLKDQIISAATDELESAAARFAMRRLDAALKRLAPSARTVEELSANFRAAVNELNVELEAASYKQHMQAAISVGNLPKILERFDNKGLLSIAARTLGLSGGKKLGEFVSRLLGSDRGTELRSAMLKELPQFSTV